MNSDKSHLPVECRLVKWGREKGFVVAAQNEVAGEEHSLACTRSCGKDRRIGREVHSCWQAQHLFGFKVDRR